MLSDSGGGFGSRMKDYYDVLDIPVTATRAEIRAQYKQLVRVYHPDRFRDAADKAYAEEKLKQINIAFQVLCGTPVQQVPQATAATPEPIADPPVLDFGRVRPGVKRKLSLQIGNSGAPASRVQLRRKGSSKLFRISNGKPVYADRPFPISYEVAVDTRHITPGTSHHEWLEIDLDGVLAHVELRLQISTASQSRIDIKRLFPRLKRWVLATVAIGIICLLIAALSAVEPRLRIYASMLPTWFNPPLHQLATDDLLFTVHEQNLSALYRGQRGGGQPEALAVSGRAAVGSAAGQRIAYLGAKGEITLLTLASDVHQTITTDSEPKTALTWSPDGTKLAYLVGEGEHSRIGLYDLTTSESRYLPEEGITGVSHYAWSPDGQVLAFDLWQGGERRVYRIGVDGTGLRPLTYVDSWGAAWSADGSSLVVSSTQGLYRLDSQGRTLTPLSAVVGEAPSWSADGQWLAYLTFDADGGGQTLWVMEMASGTATVVAAEAVSYTWSPTGAALGYVTGRVTGTSPLLYLWTTTPGQQPTLVAEVNDPFFHWTR